MTAPGFLMLFLSYSGGRQKRKATPADQNRGCRQQLRLAPFKDLMPSATLPNCLTLLWAALCQQTSWQNTPVLLPRTGSVTIMRTCRAPTGRAALWPMTSMRPAKLKAGAAAVRLVGWKMRSMDNIVDAHLVSVNEYDPATHLYTWLVTCVVRDYWTRGCVGLDLGYLNIQ